VSATLDRPKVPAEYRGLARQFRNEVRAEDEVFDRALGRVAAPLIARLRRHPRLRHELIAAATKTYTNAIPRTFRLREVEVEPDRDDFAIGEVRLTATQIHSTAWTNDDNEPGVGIAHIALAMRPRKGLVRVWTPVAIVSLHALSRWHERTGWRDHGALVRDLAVLADATDDGDRVPTNGGGYWRGRSEPMLGTDGSTATARNVRTWVAMIRGEWC
jgi:hypothetical protein